MDDRTEAFEIEEPDYEWDHEEAVDRPPRILWGRILALGVFLILAFWLGRTTSPEVDTTAELADVREQLELAQDEIDDLEARLAAQPAEDPTPAPAAEQTPAEDEEQEVQGEERTYVVKSGDTLAAIAQRFYGDSTLDGVIAEANGISDARDIRPGDELVIPPQP